MFAPDHTAETFMPGTGRGGGIEPGGIEPGGIEPDGIGRGGTDVGGEGGGREAGRRQASFRERTSDPDTADDWILAEYEFTLREADGAVRIVREAHRLGSFRRETWLRLLADAGFRVIETYTRTDPGRRPHVAIVAKRVEDDPAPAI